MERVDRVELQDELDEEIGFYDENNASRSHLRSFWFWIEEECLRGSFVPLSYECEIRVRAGVL